VTDSKALIYIVGAEHGARKLLSKIVLLDSRARRADHSERIGAVTLPDAPQLAHDEAIRLVPAHRRESTILAQQGLRQSLRMMDELIGCGALGAERALIDRVIFVGFEPDELLIL
jgi:hypothetical protein